MSNVTARALEVLEVLGDLERSSDRKTADLVRVRSNVERSAPRVPNTLGLPTGPLEVGGSCGGYSPEFCGCCYAAALERWPSVRALLGRNLERFEALEAVGGSRAIAVALVRMLERFALECDRYGVVPTFRPYWAGDMRGAVDARAWRRAMLEVPGVRFWQYTRTLEAVPILADVPNLTLLVSIDAGNERRARRMLERFPGVRAAASAATFEDARALAPGGVECPENAGRLPILVHQSGRRSLPLEVGTDARGACQSCRFCLEPRGGRPVLFSEAGR